ncbi:MAG: hypothetical protein CM15mP74_36420 [Halieaceae bacterium]|nr:MAG: hypothetical protein CM15mP74_36420 [Halieaceae bacterium]
MAMKLIKKRLTTRSSCEVTSGTRCRCHGKPINGEEKVKILVAEDLIKVTVPSPKEEAPQKQRTPGEMMRGGSRREGGARDRRF